MPQIEDFFDQHPHRNHQPHPMSYVSMRSLPGTEDDVFLRPPLWEDIASSIQNIDPENANMLGVGQGQVKMEAVDDMNVNCVPTPSPLLSPLEIKTEKVGYVSSHILHNSSYLINGSITFIVSDHAPLSNSAPSERFNLPVQPSPELHEPPIPTADTSSSPTSASQ